tara:strand:+ start:319 stop:657 length:339 start_codon:yes stop_codon:yes gene_type:complete
VKTVITALILTDLVVEVAVVVPPVLEELEGMAILGSTEMFMLEAAVEVGVIIQVPMLPEGLVVVALAVKQIIVVLVVLMILVVVPVAPEPAVGLRIVEAVAWLLLDILRNKD